MASTSDVGDALDIGYYQNVSIQAVGTYTGSSVVTMQVSNDGGTTWATAKDNAGSDLTFGANGLKQLGVNAKLIRPSIATGTGTVSIHVMAF